MSAKRNLLLCLMIFLVSFTASAQELNCVVEMIAEKLPTTDSKVFQTLKGQITEFMNSKKWTNDVFSANERIDCKISIHITGELGSDYYSGSISIQSSRPIFNAGLNSTMLNWIDKDFVINYVEYQPLEFNEQAFSNNLVSILAFYANTIIGIDYDSFSPKGGTPYFLKAQAIVNSIPQNLGDKAPGWRPFDGTRNRYWITENLLNPNYEAAREASYMYHRLGMDMMYDNLKVGRQNVFNAVKKMEDIVKNYPNTMIMQMFFDAKRDELVGMFTKAPQPDKGNAHALLVEMDPTKAEKYSILSKN